MIVIRRMSGRLGTSRQSFGRSKQVSPERRRYLIAGAAIRSAKRTNRTIADIRVEFLMVEQQSVIAVVDDDSAMREALQRLLSSYGYRTELYSSAEEFLDAAIKSNAACLLVDVQLGDISGIELGRHLTAAGFKFPIIFMTASSDQEIHRQAIDFGCVAFFQKPFGANELIDAIRQAMAPLSSSDGDVLDDMDHLLTLLRRYQAERKAFDDAVAIRAIDTDSVWDMLAKTTWANTQDEIIKMEPRATTATGALLALEHVLKSEDLFADRAESAELEMLWLLVKAARDFIASTEGEA
jgi:FixJ family two-component response regulator